MKKLISFLIFTMAVLLNANAIDLEKIKPVDNPLDGKILELSETTIFNKKFEENNVETKTHKVRKIY